MSSFNYWYNEIADMPTQVDGEWVDLETGIPYKRYADNEVSPKRSTKVHSSEAIEARAKAKLYGGSALKGGSGRQKAWAERIRIEKLDKCTSDEDRMLLATHWFYANTLTWIEQRDSAPSQFIAAFKLYEKLHAELNHAQEASGGVVTSEYDRTRRHYWSEIAKLQDSWKYSESNKKHVVIKNKKITSDKHENSNNKELMLSFHSMTDDDFKALSIPERSQKWSEYQASLS